MPLMTNKTKHSSPDEKWHAVSCAVEVDEIMSMTEPGALDSLIDADLAGLDDLTSARLDKAVKQLTSRIRVLVETERAALGHHTGLRAAADDGTTTAPAARLPVRLLNIQLLIEDISFTIGVLTTAPYEVVLIGTIPKERKQLQIGTQTFSLIAMKTSGSYQVRGLTETKLRALTSNSKPRIHLKV
jgi:hypothetical protein